MTAAAKSPSVIFEDVSFCLSEHGEWIVKDINISIAPGEWISIVGGNGSGKSAFVKLGWLELFSEIPMNRRSALRSKRISRSACKT